VEESAREGVSAVVDKDVVEIALVAFLTHQGTTVTSELTKRITTDLYEKAKRNLTGVATKFIAIRQHQRDDASDEPQLPPGRILGLVADAARFEDEDEMQTRYAALLANATMTHGPVKVLPSFVDILKHLVPAHVSVLDTMHLAYVRAPEHRLAARDELMRRSGLNEHDFALIAQDLDRLKLLETVSGRLGDKDDPIERWKYDEVYLSDLGLAFIRACTPPTRQ
jgi:hypothetical protein